MTAVYDTGAASWNKTKLTNMFKNRKKKPTGNQIKKYEVKKTRRTVYYYI